MATTDDTIRLQLVDLVDADPTAYVERWRPPVPGTQARPCPLCTQGQGSHRDLCVEHTREWWA